MTLHLPIVHDLVEQLPNAFPPRNTPVPQPRTTDGDGRAAAQQIMGFFTDTTLCIGCKACEVACKQWNQLPADNLKFTGYSFDNTKWLSAATWRHVAFKEKIGEDAVDGGDGPGSRWLMLSDVCKHCESAPCQHSCPTGAILYNQFGDVYVQNDICNGCGYCVTACPFGVLDRADRLATNVSENGDGDPDGPRGDGRAHKCTLCMDRQVDGLTPACAKACPTASIQFGPIEDLRATARRRVDELRNRGNGRAYLYGCDSVGDYGPLNAFFLLEDHPNEYNLPEAPPQPFRGQGRRYAASLAAGVALTLFSALVFGKSGKRK
jgi:formate dehydrogenase iron-sulfur subunit